MPELVPFSPYPESSFADIGRGLKEIDPILNPYKYADSINALKGMRSTNKIFRDIAKRREAAARLQRARAQLARSPGARDFSQVYPGYAETTPTSELPPAPTAQELADPKYQSQALARFKARATAKKTKGIAATKIQNEIDKLDSEIELARVELEELKETAPQLSAELGGLEYYKQQKLHQLKAKKLAIKTQAKIAKRSRLAGVEAQEGDRGEVFFQKEGEEAIQGKFVKPKTPGLVRLPGIYETPETEVPTPEAETAGAQDEEVGAGWTLVGHMNGKKIYVTPDGNLKREQ